MLLIIWVLKIMKYHIDKQNSDIMNELKTGYLELFNYGIFLTLAYKNALEDSI